MADTNSSSAANKPSSAALSASTSSGALSTGTYYATPTTANAPKVSSKSVTLKKGDKLWRVATDAGISLETLVKINGLKDYSVKPGKVLQLP